MLESCIIVECVLLDFCSLVSIVSTVLQRTIFARYQVAVSELRDSVYFKMYRFKSQLVDFFFHMFLDFFCTSVESRYASYWVNNNLKSLKFNGETFIGTT